MRILPGHAAFAGAGLVLRVSTVRPPMIAGLLVALGLIGLIIWLALAGADAPPAPGDSAAVRLDLAAPPATEAPASAEATPAEAPEATNSAEPAVAAPAIVASVEAEAHGAATGPKLAAVDPALIQDSSHGPLPRVAEDGRRPWQVYARAFTVDATTPRLALVIAGLGLDRALTLEAIKLPPEVTLAFSSYAPDLDALVELARDAGHEVMLDLPMEPVTYPTDDPGPNTLLTTLTPSENLDRLETVLGKATGYVGVSGYKGSRFTTTPDALRPILTALAERGLLYLDDKSSNESVAPQLAQQVGLPRAINDRFIDTEATRVLIDASLASVVSDAKAKGAAVALGRPYPVTLQRIAAWLPALAERGVALAPISAVVDQQPFGP
jgi:polysaccharide deacetylase 2 family uncharacterized protein YibQ